MGRQANRERKRKRAREAWQRAALGCGVRGPCGKKAHRAHEKCIFEFNRKINKRKNNKCNKNNNSMWRMGDFFLAYQRAEPKSMQQ